MTYLFSVLSGFPFDELVRAMLWALAAMPAVFIFYWMFIGIMAGLAALLGAYGDELDYDERIENRGAAA